MDIEKARTRLFAKNETNGYIERETALEQFLKTDVPTEQGERYVSALEYVLGYISVPVDPDDVLVGRMEEGPVPYEMEGVPGGGHSHAHNPFRPLSGRIAGHLNLDYADLLKKGLSGIAAGMRERAVTPEQVKYAGLAERAAEAVRDFALRYAQAAEQCGNTRAAEALRKVPYGPAADFYSAVQSIWLFHLIVSCVTGGRDFGYSRLDLTLWPYFDASEEEEDVLEILEDFYLKNNEIGGMNADIGVQMPVPCGSTNMYMMLGGKGAEEALPLSLLFMKAAEKVHLQQPITALRISKDSAKAWKIACAEASQTLSGQASLYNDDALIPNLKKLGYPEDRALHYTMSGCNRADFAGHMSNDGYHNGPACFLKAFYDPEVKSMEDLTEAFRREMRKDMEGKNGHKPVPQQEEVRFYLESMLLRGCPEQVLDIENGGQYMETMVHHLCGAATVGNSFAAVEKAVFEDRIMTLDEFRALVRDDFKADPELHARIRNRYPKFGNDNEKADEWTHRAAEIMTDAAAEQSALTGRLHIPCLYSLYFHHDLGRVTGATPDGRLSGEPLSENQSPVYGTDREGITALMLSVGRLPQEKIGCGGLNVRLEKKLDNEVAAGLVDAFFELGCVNLCLDVMDRATLLDAKAHPERYQTLCVRIVGYSEIFVRLPEYMQQELINRTAFAV